MTDARNGHYRYHPALNFTEMTNSSRSMVMANAVPATIRITVTPVNDAPVFVAPTPTAPTYGPKV